MRLPSRIGAVIKHFWLFLLTFACLQGSDWRLSGPFGGSATVVAIDPSQPKLLLAGTRQAHIFRSENGGESWAMLPFPRNFAGSVQAILIDPADSKHYLVGVHAISVGGGGLFESFDAGVSWKRHSQLEGNSIEALTLYPGNPRIIGAGTRQGVFRSSDAGKTWDRVSPKENDELKAVTAVAFDPRNPDVMYAGTTHLPWKTSDGGKTWDSIHTGMLDDSDVFSIYVNFRQPDQIFASACSGIYRSTSGGQMWQKFTGIPGTQRRTHIIRQDPEHPETLFAGTTVGLLKSADSGATWKLVNNLHINSLTFDPTNPNVIYFAAEFTGLWKSTDRGETIKPLNLGFVNRKVNRITAAGKRIYINALQDGVSGAVFFSEDGGENWQRKAPGALLAGPALSSLSGGKSEAAPLFAATENQFFKSVDGGNLWRQMPLLFRAKKGAPLTAIRGKIQALETIHAAKPILILGHSTGLYRSVDLGVSWTRIALEGTSVVPIAAIYSSADNSGRLLARGMSSLYASTDAGATFRTLASPVAADRIYDAALPPSGDGPVLLATVDGLYRSDTLGGDWTLCNNGLPRETISSVRYHPGRTSEAYAVSYGRLYRSADAGVQWTSVAGNSAPVSDIRSLWIGPELPDRLLALTADLGVMFLDLPETR